MSYAKFAYTRRERKILLKPTVLQRLLAALLSLALLGLLLRWLLDFLVRRGAEFALGTLLFGEVHLLDVGFFIDLRRLESHAGLALDVPDADELLGLVCSRLRRSDDEPLQPG